MEGSHLPMEQDWHPRARAWISEHLGVEYLKIDQVRERHWGSIWTVDTGDQRWWFKRGHPRLHHEVALRRILRDHAPALILPVVADHPTEGWMLTEDQGGTLSVRASKHPDQGLRILRDLAQAIAQVQRSVPLEAVTRPGLDEFRPDHAVETLDRALAWFTALPPDHPAHVGTGRRDRALEAMAHVVERWDRVRADSIPDLAIDHNDLHLGNAFPGPVISDWGDAVIGHPFGTVRHLLVTAQRLHGTRAAETVKGAYLSEWGDPAELDEALETAVRLQVPNRLNCWWRLDSPDMVAEYAQYINPLIDEIGQGWDTVTEP
ncbi:phosphotransferase [Micrococcus terreus]|uniref:Aminoglycoside phosphotransferase domain-containing protein n=1 Tax=Micrococcus terreus TaxID=574650 RepID=A0A1I7MGE5_9MICC|nr:phosphotransferase [Micrococcus terreus]SFV20993.1 hypothetical protein SAMN04487966_102126 [Micrococcus terreus]